jgi:Tfp pilus assembly protein PilN
MRAVNLLPVQSSTRLPKSTVMPLAGAAAAVVAAGIVGTLAHAESAKVAKEQRQLDNLKAQLSNLPSAKATAGTETPLIASRASRYAAVQAALSGRVAWDTVLRQIALVLPSDTWLDGLQLSAPTTGDPTATAATTTSPTATASTATEVVITGFTSSPAGLARVIQRLSVVPSLTDVALGSAQAQMRGSKRVFQFTINANIATAGGGS